MPCNKPQKSWKPSKKKVVRACSGGREKIIHFGATGYGNNYSDAARKSFRARHRCSTANDKLTARYWACKNLWTKGGSVTSCPKGRRCKGVSRSYSPKSNSPKRKSPKRKSRSKRKSPKRKSRSKRKSPKRKSPKRKSPKRKSRSKRKSPKRKSRSRRKS